MGVVREGFLEEEQWRAFWADNMAQISRVWREDWSSALGKVALGPSLQLRPLLGELGKNRLAIVAGLGHREP